MKPSRFPCTVKRDKRVTEATASDVLTIKRSKYRQLIFACLNRNQMRKKLIR